jgi:putative transposase
MNELATPDIPLVTTHTTPSLAELTEHDRQLALVRFEILRPCIEHGVTMADAARANGLRPRTVQRWRTTYDRAGLVGLARKRRSDRGQSKALSPTLAGLVEGLALRRPAPTAAAVHRQVADVATRHGWTPPTYASVYAAIAALDPGLVCIAHEGSKAYREAFDLIHRREAERPNEIWQADHTLLDIWLLDERGKPCRPWLTSIIDDHSRALSGYFLGFQAPSALITALALRQAIWRKEDPRWHVCGIPDTFYTDHGSDFTSCHIEQVAAALKMRLVFSIPGMPRGRGRVERFFETVNQLLLCDLPGYTPGDSAKAGARLSLAEFETRFHEFLLGNYHQRLHSATNMAPQTRWDASGFLPRLPESLEHLDLLLLTVARSRRVRQDGIHFQSLRYIDLTLAGYVGQDVTIRYDPRDLAEIRVYHENLFVCRAVCQEIAGQTISLKEIIRARNRRRRELRSTLDDRNAVVEQLLAAHRSEADNAAPAATSSTPAAAPGALKRYINE